MRWVYLPFPTFQRSQSASFGFFSLWWATASLLPPPFTVSKPCRQDSSQNLWSGFTASVVRQPDAVTMFKCEWLQPLLHPFSSSFCRNPQEAFRKNWSQLKVLKTQFSLFFIGTVPFTTISGRMPLCDQQNQEKPLKCGWNHSLLQWGSPKVWVRCEGLKKVHSKASSFHLSWDHKY